MSKPHKDCHATKEELLSKRKNPLDVDDDCPICERRGVRCEVGCHPSSIPETNALAGTIAPNCLRFHVHEADQYFPMRL